MSVQELERTLRTPARRGLIWTLGLRGLYPDLLEPGTFGRAQSVQHALRGVALAGALVGGGFLLDLWHPAPFLIAALVTTVACGAVIVFVREDGGHGRVFRGFRAYLATNWKIVREEPEVRRFLLANAAWEGTFAAMRIFVVLYLTRGLDQPARVASLVLAVVAGGYVVAALGSGPFADRIGLARFIFACSWVYGLGLLFGGLATQWHTWYYALIFPVAIAGGAVMTQAWALLFTLVPDRHRGAISGLATMTEGAGAAGGAGARWRGDRSRLPVSRADRGLRRALARLRDSDPRGDPARLRAHAVGVAG